MESVVYASSNSRSHVATNVKVPGKELMRIRLVFANSPVFRTTKMSSSLTPYNFTITDQSPLFQYSPFRDGAITNGWNVTYTAELNPGSRVGAGVSNSTTFWISN